MWCSKKVWSKYVIVHLLILSSRLAGVELVELVTLEIDSILRVKRYFPYRWSRSSSLLRKIRSGLSPSSLCLLNKKQRVKLHLVSQAVPLLMTITSQIKFG